MTGLPTLEAALDWIERHWDMRTPPQQLTRPETEGELGGLALSKAFEQFLSATPNQTVDEVVTAPCLHWSRPPGGLCGACGVRDGSGRVIAETGTYQKAVLRYRWPMWRAVTRLQNALRERNQPHPYALILSLAAAGWDARQAAQTVGLPWDYAEAAYLRAIRQLHGRYEEVPISTRRNVTRAQGSIVWTELSESMQKAIQAGETAAA